jgi:hypothetical protein
MGRLIVSAICVLAAASALSTESLAGALSATDIGGRWQGGSYARDGGGPLTLDVVACGTGWCGIKVAANDSCGGTALKLDGGAAEGDNLVFKGTLELAPGTEPYVVQGYLIPASNDAPMALQIIGDTGGQFRAYRRSFPFEATMARTRDAVCRAPQSVSSAE